jgi:hypothetical protein
MGGCERVYARQHPLIRELTTLFSAYSSVHTLQYILFSTPEGVTEGVPEATVLNVKRQNVTKKGSIVVDHG